MGPAVTTKQTHPLALLGLFSDLLANKNPYGFTSECTQLQGAAATQELGETPRPQHRAASREGGLRLPGPGRTVWKDGCVCLEVLSSPWGLGLRGSRE